MNLNTCHQLMSLYNFMPEPRNSAQLTRDKSRCTQKEAEAFCVSIGLPASDGEAMWLHWEEILPNGKQRWSTIKDWQLKIRKWKAFGYLPSQNQKRFYTRPKEKVAGEAYKPIPPRREVSDIDFQRAGEIAKQEIEKLKKHMAALRGQPNL
jgi:hypothetical protein